jgi:hypothetical protein
MANPTTRRGTPAASDVGDKAQRAASKAERSKPFGALVVIGLVAYGVIHLAVAWIALQLAWFGHSGTEADQKGALKQLANTPLGPLWLWLVAIGLFALVLWRLGLAVWGFGWKRGWRRISKRLGSVCQAIVYGALAVSAIGVTLGSGSSSGQQRSMSGQLMQHPYGRVLLGLVGAVIVGIGIYLCIKGIRKTFVDELRDGGGRPTNLVGRIGYFAKGVAYVIVGVIVGWAALRHNAAQAGGLDAALRTVKQQPFGPVLLTALAAGFACFGLYCFGWARRARR